MNLSKEDKCKIAARLFYDDNRDQYEDFHEAFVEFASGLNVSEAFLETVVSLNVKPRSGHRIVLGPNGALAAVREVDGFFEPISNMTHDEGAIMEGSFNVACEEYTDLDEWGILNKIGWKVIA